MKVFNWAVVGTGHAASKFVKDLQFIPHHRVSHVSSKSKLRAEEFIHHHELHSQATEHDSLPEIRGINAIYIATNSDLHFLNVKTSLSLGIPVLCEKPLSLSFNEVTALYALALERNVTLIEGLWTLFLPGMCKLKNFIATENNPTYFSLQATYGKKFEFDPNFRLFSKDKSGGALYDLGIYPVAASVFLFGEPILNDFIVDRAKSGVVLSFKANLSFEGGVEANVQSSIVKNLSNTLTLNVGSKKLMIEAPFIGNSSLICQEGEFKSVIHSSNEVSGIGLWREAAFVEQITKGFCLPRLIELQKISISSHRILQEIKNGEQEN